jgi:integrase
VPALPTEVQDELIEAAHEKIRDYVLMSLDTGGRQSELLDLTWRDVDLASGTLTVTKPKGKRVRLIPLTPGLRKRLAELNERREEPKEPSDRVLSMLPRTWNDRLRKLFSEAAAAIGHPDLVPHDLRHLFATTLASQGVPIATIGALLGHDAGSLTVTMRYVRHQPENAAYEAIQKLTDARNRVEEERASYSVA